MLAKAGARSVSVSYDAFGGPDGLLFTIDTPFGEQSFGLPVDSRKVEQVLNRDGVAPRYCTPEHAQRVGWRVVKDWLEAQLAILATEMVTLDQIMLPYLRDDTGRTMYDLYRERQLALEAGA